MKINKEIILFLNELVDVIEKHDVNKFISSFSFKYDVYNTIDYIKELEETDNVDTSKLGTFIENGIDYLYSLNPIGPDIITNKSKQHKKGYEDILEKL